MKNLETLQQIKSKIIYDELDSNIADLVRTLNNIPSVVTIQSCGGHDHPRAEFNQAGAGYWYVTFHTEDAWAVALIAADAMVLDEYAKLAAFYQPTEDAEGLDVNDLFYVVRGKAADLMDFTDLLAKDVREAPKNHFWDVT